MLLLQVSKAWQFLAEDCVLWENIFRKITAITQEKPICEGGTCKDKVKSLISKRRNLQRNWKVNIPSYDMTGFHMGMS